MINCIINKIFIILFCIIPVISFSHEKTDTQGQVDKKVEKENRLKIANALLAERKDINKHKTAVTMYENLCKEYNDDYELLWKTAKLFYYLAQRYKDDSDKSIPYYKKGAHYGKLAIKLNPKGYDGKYWWTINYIQTATGLESITILKESKKIKALCEEMIKDEPKRFPAYMMLGAMYRSLPGAPLAWGDNDKSLEILKKAEKLAPDDPELLIEIAETYVELGKKEEAKKYYQKASTAPSPEGMEFETEDAHIYAKKRIKELE